MRTLFALLLFGLAAWRGLLDWNATFALGGAWRFAATGQLCRDYFPDVYAVMQTLVSGYLGLQVWHYAERALALPLVSWLLFAGALVWMLRRPKGVARRNVFKR